MDMRRLKKYLALKGRCYEAADANRQLLEVDPKSLGRRERDEYEKALWAVAMAIHCLEQRAAGLREALRVDSPEGAAAARSLVGRLLRGRFRRGGTMTLRDYCWLRAHRELVVEALPALERRWPRECQAVRAILGGA
jgi:hypothetical protein